MADRTFTIRVVTPERTVLTDEATSLVAPGIEGSFGVLPNHAPLLSELVPGEMRFRRNSSEEVRIALGGGFLQVFENQVTILADTAERPEEINPDRARASLDEAREQLRRAQAQYDEAAVHSAQVAIERAQNRLRIAGGR